jgi:hypothetical protein
VNAKYYGVYVEGVGEEVHQRQRWWYNFRHVGWIATKIDRLLEEILLKVTNNFGCNPSRNKKVITSSNSLFLVMGAP